MEGIFIMTTSCDKCGAIEHTLVSMNAKCMYCKKGTMKIKELSSYD